MQTRSRAAATTALLLTASVTGLAAASGTAQATTAATHTHTAARAAAAPVVTIKANKGSLKLSSDKIKPGKTMFKVVRGTANGSIQLLRLKSGYTIADLAADIGPLMAGDVPTVQRVDANVVFYGGIPIPASGARPNMWGTDIDKAGTYYVINLKRSTLATIKAKGAHQTRSLPSADGKLGMKGSMTFNAPASNPHRGWMKTTNNAIQPHFVNLSQVKKSTTDADVQAWLAAPSGPPTFFKPGGGEADTEVVSPGHTIVWKYHVPKGKYLSLCFYPDKDTGVPHAFMGMYALMNMK
jgi:flagellar hook-length control protein FliK